MSETEPLQWKHSVYRGYSNCEYGHEISIFNNATANGKGYIPGKYRC
jgi:hypothetical protein